MRGTSVPGNIGTGKHRYAPVSMVVNHKEANGESDAKCHKTFQRVTSVMTHSVPSSVERTNRDITGLQTIHVHGYSRR